MDIMIVTGFLGSGKTAAILATVDRVIERTGKRVVVLKNDFGRIGIDAKVMRNSGLTVREIHSGCVCCTLEEDFMEALGEIAWRFGPDMVIVEPSGVADPTNILLALRRFKEADLDSIKTVAVVDAVRFDQVLRAFPNPVKRQLGAADMVLVSKIDEVKKTDLVDVLACLFDLGVKVPIISASLVNGANLDRVVEEMVRA